MITTIAMPSSRDSSFIKCRICAWMVTSSAVVGSSAMISLGLHASPIAIITRWRIPPENWCGYWPSRRSASEMPTIRKSSTARPCASLSFMPLWMNNGSMICRPMVSTGIERGHRLLEDHRDVAAAHGAHLVLGKREQVAALEQQCARASPARQAWRAAA